MKKRYWVVNILDEVRHGPYPTKRTAQRARTVIRTIPDLFLEVGTNVGVTGEHEAEFAGVQHYPEKSMYFPC